MSKYYLAYGSNLSIEQMEIRTPDAKIIGTGMLKGWQLLFRQYATIRKNKKFNTPVLVWEISDRDEKNLDKYEGFPRFYVKKNLTLNVTSLDGEDLGELSGMVYIMTDKAVQKRSDKPMPSAEYLAVIDSGYTHFGFNKRVFEEALEEALASILTL